MNLSEEKNNELKLKLLGPAAESAGETLQNLWELVFGRFDFYVQRKQLARENAFKEFKESLEKRIIEIPPHAIKEPSISILGPTLEASKFYFEEKPLRDMFVSLAAATMDQRKERGAHPSFPEIIKQMSPLDAKNLSLFTHQFPVAEYYKKKKRSESRNTLLSNVFLGNKEVQDLELQSRSLSSLSRLGLIQIEYEKTLMAEQFYEQFYTTDFFLQLAAELNCVGYLAGVTPGRALATPLGKAFMSVCLE